MKGLLFLTLAGTFFFVSGVVLAEERRLITSDEFVKKLSEQPEKGTPGIKMRGIKKVKSGRPEITVQILFKFGTAGIADDYSKLQLDEAGKALSSKTLSKYRFEIAGHTDSIGSEEFNLKLSEHRAKVIIDYLCKQYGISENKFEIKGYGESMPVASNETEDGRAKNRRVIFKRLEWSRSK